ncbi:MAG: hypothetical protein HOL80_02150, partial [Candidatus Magasanikbacteria bacterium]|nr:hypothetical protein [Candidatus Magasanikbacteria bacterium]
FFLLFPVITYAAPSCKCKVFEAGMDPNIGLVSIGGNLGLRAPNCQGAGRTMTVSSIQDIKNAKGSSQCVPIVANLATVESIEITGSAAVDIKFWGTQATDEDVLVSCEDINYAHITMKVGTRTNCRLPNLFCEGGQCQDASGPHVGTVGTCNFPSGYSIHTINDCTLEGEELVKEDEGELAYFHIREKINTLNIGKAKKPADIIGKAIKLVMGIVGAIALVMFVYAGGLWMVAGGNAEQTTKAMKTMVWSAIGLIVILSSYSIVNFIFTSTF